jgi:hypothetical protein
MKFTSLKTEIFIVNADKNLITRICQQIIVRNKEHWEAVSERAWVT